MYVKGELIINLVKAHCNGGEEDFERAVNNIILDEEKKGNVSLATSIKKAYAKKTIYGKSNLSLEKPQSFHKGALESYQNIPKDKDNSLSLFDIVYSDVGLNDVVLPKKQKGLLFDFISEYQNREKLSEMGFDTSNRLLLCGPPGCGKTITAKAIAHELSMPIAYVRLDALISSYLGQTSTNLRKIFDAVENEKVILFLDEFDAIAKKRDDNLELGELKRVVTSLLQNFDNINNQLVLIAATNHPQLLDPAIWRRFNYSILIDFPDENGREEMILKIIDRYNFSINFKINHAVKVTEGLSNSQIEDVFTSIIKIKIMNKYVDKTIEIDDLLKALLNKLTLYTSNSGHFQWEVLGELKEKGLTLRDLENITGIPKSTIEYNLKKGGVKNGGEVSTSMDSK